MLNSLIISTWVLEFFRMSYLFCSFKIVSKMILNYDEVIAYEKTLHKIKVGIFVFAIFIEVIKIILTTSIFVVCPFRANNVSSYCISDLSSVVNLILSVKLSMIVKR